MSETAIALQGVSKRFESRGAIVDALRPTDLSVRKGEIVGLLGFSGAGKSTLLRVINLLERPTSGQVLVHGRDMTKLTASALREARHSIGMIFQQFNLLSHSTAIENVAFALRVAGIAAEERRKRASEALAIVGLSDKENAYPAQLSGGQRQRVAIARALVHRPDILLCDEATSALDPHTSLSILRFLKKLNLEQGMTMAVVTHDIKVASYICNRAVIMEKGRIIETLDMAAPQPKTPLGRFFIDTAKGWTDATELPTGELD